MSKIDDEFYNEDHYIRYLKDLLSNGEIVCLNRAWGVIDGPLYVLGIAGCNVSLIFTLSSVDHSINYRVSPDKFNTIVKPTDEMLEMYLVFEWMIKEL